MKDREINHIVVGVDLSDYSKIVVKEALELGKKLHVPITFLYVYSEVHSAEYTKYLTPSLLKSVRHKYRLSDDSDIVIKYGKPADQIIVFAKKVKNPLIVLGHKGHSRILRMFLGSTAERVALLSSFPVWIHRGNKIGIPHKILVPSDLTARTDKTLNDVKTLQRAFDADTEVYHVWQDPFPIFDYPAWPTLYHEIKKTEETKVRRFKSKHPELKTAEIQGDVVGQIQSHMRGFDVLAISPRNHKGKVPMFGSVTAKLVRSGNKPVLVCP